MKEFSEAYKYLLNKKLSAEKNKKPKVEYQKENIRESSREKDVYSREANIYSREANTYSKEANIYSREANTYSKEANIYSRERNTYSREKEAEPDSREKNAKIKITAISTTKMTIRPSTKTIASILHKFENSIYIISSNSWEFNQKYYENICAELESSNIEFEKIPKGSLAMIRKQTIKQNFQLDGPIYGRLMGFQREGVQFGLRRNGRILLADDMGLGKTIQALAMAYFYRLEWPLLIFAPASLLDSWAIAIKDFLNEEAVIVKEKSAMHGAIQIVSYSIAARLGEMLNDMNYKVVIADECHYLKSATSKRTSMLLPVLQKSSRLIMISGTPAISRPLELYPIIISLDRKAYSNFYEYGMRYCNGRLVGGYYDFKGCSNAQELSIALENAYMIRRTKNEVLGELPKKHRKQILLDGMRMECAASEKIDCNFMDDIKPSILEEFKNAVVAKKGPVLKYIESLLAKNTKMVIFAHHQDMLNELEEHIKGKNVRYIRIDGSTPTTRRQSYVDAFQKDERIRIAILSITACSTGLTLTAGKAVVFAELYWNPGTLLQAEDRIHRIGQRDDVEIHYLVAKHTVDEKVWPYILKKLNVLESLNIGKNELKHVKGKELGEKEQGKLDNFITKG